MARVSDLGQMREAGTDLPNMYSQYSVRPYPYKSERKLIDEGLLTDLIPTWGNMNWPSFVPPPPVPSLEHERMEIKRGMRKRLWPHAGTWNLNVNPLEGLMLPNQKVQTVGAITGGAFVLGALVIKNEPMKKLFRNVGYVMLGVTLLDYLSDKIK